MRRASAAAALAAAAIAGCGGGGGNADAAARATLERYFAALADGRGVAACNELTVQSRQLIGEAAARLPGKPSTCAAAVRTLVASRFFGRLAALRHPKITSLSVTGDRATARVAGVDTPLRLTRAGGPWQIDFKPSVETD